MPALEKEILLEFDCLSIIASALTLHLNPLCASLRTICSASGCNLLRGIKRDVAKKMTRASSSSRPASFAKLSKTFDADCSFSSAVRRHILRELGTDFCSCICCCCLRFPEVDADASAMVKVMCILRVDR